MTTPSRLPTDSDDIRYSLNRFKTCLRTESLNNNVRSISERPIPIRAAFRSGRTELIELGGVLPINKKTGKPGSMRYFASKHLAKSIVVWKQMGQDVPDAEKQWLEAEAVRKLIGLIPHVARGDIWIEATYDRIVQLITEGNSTKPPFTTITLHDLKQAANTALKTTKPMIVISQMGSDGFAHDDLIDAASIERLKQKDPYADFIEPLSSEIKAIVTLRLEGHRWKEVAIIRDISPRSLYRQLRELRTRFET